MHTWLSITRILCTCGPWRLHHRCYIRKKQCVQFKVSILLGFLPPRKLFPQFHKNQRNLNSRQKEAELDIAAENINMVKR